MSVFEIVAALDALNAKFAAGEVKSVQHGNERSQLVSQGLAAAAKALDTELVVSGYIDANGEYNLSAQHPDGRLPMYGCGKFSQAFVDVLNQHHPRCGVLPTAHLTVDAGWCRLNHFDAERLIRQVAASLASTV